MAHCIVVEPQPNPFAIGRGVVRGAAHVNSKVFFEVHS
jgi:hypothetical protein